MNKVHRVSVDSHMLCQSKGNLFNLETEFVDRERTSLALLNELAKEFLSARQYLLLLSLFLSARLDCKQEGK